MKRLKTPINIYGGKTEMLRYIRPLIPSHRIYTEAFFGGGANLFDKEPSQIEVINDIDQNAINFYECLVSDFEKLKVKIDCSLSSRYLHEKAKKILKRPKGKSKIDRAWAFWFAASMGYAGKVNGGYAYDTCDNKDALSLISKKARFTEDLKRRLEKTQIECGDAVKVIKSRDRKDTFHFIDPPYLESDQGHYRGYKEMDFLRLLICLTTLEGKFMLCHYDNYWIRKFAKANNWYVKEYDMPIRINNRESVLSNKKKRKTEIIIMNYNPETITGQLSLLDSIAEIKS
jgi:DNA adenine methylase